MRSLGAISAILAAFLSSADAVTEKIPSFGEKSIPWPENGSIKFSTPTSPPKITVDVVSCFKVNVDFAENSVQVQKPSGEPITLPATERLRPEGGQLVVLISMFGGENHVIVNAEDETGAFQTRMQSFPAVDCKLSRVSVTGPDGVELPSDAHVAISQEIVDDFRMPKYPKEESSDNGESSTKEEGAAKEESAEASQ
ncbi:hypothetical protein, conserved [Eimeria praecox]|uniref:Uncharacterized protein n=1 Tax=Eimeria praecox TaxID=51316 RepID=U6GU72_9EIME|nr:hypothetical protein, conserved [Eimeria praecox]